MNNTYEENNKKKLMLHKSYKKVIKNLETKVEKETKSEKDKIIEQDKDAKNIKNNKKD